MAEHPVSGFRRVVWFGLVCLQHPRRSRRHAAPEVVLEGAKRLGSMCIRTVSEGVSIQDKKGM